MLTFAPDAPSTTPELLTAVSAVPTSLGYGTPPAGASAGVDQLPDPPQGGALLEQPDGSPRTIIGTETALLELSGAAWVDQSDTPYVSGAERWCFAQVGITAFAANKATQLRYSDSGAFAITTNAPMCSSMDACSGFLVLFDIDGTGTGYLVNGASIGNVPDGWACSQIFNPKGDWVTDPATQANYGQLVDTPGRIVRGKRLGGQMVAYKAKSIYVGSFTGPPDGITWVVASTDVGCVARDGVVGANFMDYFIGDDNFYAFDGTRPVPIGEQIKRYFFFNVNRTLISTVRALHDRANSRIYWFYPTGNDAALTSYVVYHYLTQRWGAADLTVTEVLSAVTGEITYDNLDDLFPTYDDLPDIPYNSPFWTANTPVLAYVDEENNLLSLSADGDSMYLRTGYTGTDERVTLCTRWRVSCAPNFTPANASVTPFSSWTLDESPVSDGRVDVHEGRADVLISGRFQGAEVSLSGTTEVLRLTPTLVDTGEE